MRQHHTGIEHTEQSRAGRVYGPQDSRGEKDGDRRTEDEGVQPPVAPKTGRHERSGPETDSSRLQGVAPATRSVAESSRVAVTPITRQAASSAARLTYAGTRTT